MPKPSFNPQRFLTEDEKADYQNLKYGQGRELALKRLQALKETKKQTSSNGFSNYLKSRVGLAKSPAKSLSSSLYGNQQPTVAVGFRTGKRGRPRGTKDPRYAAYGGVYEFRKLQAQRRALEKIRARQMGQVTPEQQDMLSRAARQRYAAQMNPENQVIPDTFGRVKTKSIQDEINDACNIVP